MFIAINQNRKREAIRRVPKMKLNECKERTRFGVSEIKNT